MAIRYSQSTEQLPETGLHRFFKSHAAKISLQIGDELSSEGDEPCVSYVTKGWIQRRHTSDCGRQAVTGTYVRVISSTSILYAKKNRSVDCSH